MITGTAASRATIRRTTPRPMAAPFCPLVLGILSSRSTYMYMTYALTRMGSALLKCVNILNDNVIILYTQSKLLYYQLYIHMKSKTALKV